MSVIIKNNNKVEPWSNCDVTEDIVKIKRDSHYGSPFIMREVNFTVA